MELGLGVLAPATGARADVVVRAPDGATLADVTDQLLATVLLDRATGTLSVGGEAIAGNALLGRPPLVEGALLQVDAPARAQPLPALPELRVVGGPDAGGVHLLAPGVMVVGREGVVRLTDPQVAPEHCRVTLGHANASVEDLGTTDGTWLDGVRVEGTTDLPYGGMLRVGATTLVLSGPSEPAAPLTPLGDGRVAFNRPPRLRPPQPVVQVVVPAPPEERDRSPLPLLAILAPLVLGVVMWRVLGNATFLLFTLLSPVMVVGNVLTERRTGRRQSRRQKAVWRAQRDVAERTLAEAVRADEQRRRSDAPDPAVVLQTALGPRPRLWERRRSDDDLLALRLGLADQPARLEAEGDLTEAMTVARAVPVVVPLTAAGVLGLAGPRGRTQAMARWLVAQTAVLHSPRDVQVVIVADPAAATAWEWAARLPHCAPDAGQDCRATLGLGTAQAAARVSELAALIEARRAERAAASPTARTDDRPVLLVVDGARALRAISGLSAVLADGPSVGVFTIALEQDARLLPEECGATAVLGGDAETRLAVRIAGVADLTDAVADAVSPSYADAIARALAPLRDDGRDRGADGLPASVRWTDVTELPLAGGGEDVARVITRWAAPGRTTAAVLGRGPDGVFAVDIDRHGPHALVAGTTGAGKSELLQTLIASLAAGNRPDELNVLLVDFKGGAAFGPCARLPHTVGMVTDLDGALVERALASLTAELRRREGVLAAAGAKDLADYRRSGRGSVPRLVIVVDEFATLAEELPDFVGGLVGIAQRGRSLGVHLILATQRPEGVVSADIRANTNLRLCLGVTREAESRDVIDSPVAATISRTTPGRAYARTGHADLTPFQTARVGGRRPAVVAADETPTVAIVPAAEAGDPVPRYSGAEHHDEVTDLSLLVDACISAAERLGIPAPTSPWLPPLPTLLTLDEIPAPDDARVGTSGRIAPLVIGVCDVPESQSRRPLVLDLEASTHLMVLGSPRSGRTTALRTLAGSVARSTSADDVHLYVIDPGGGLGALASLPHTGAVVGRDAPERINRVLTWLAEEVTRRQALLGAGGHAGISEQRAATARADRLPHLVVMLDRWEAFLATYQDLDAGRLVELFYRLLREGPSAGLHVVMTADRTGLIGRVSSMIQDRLVLRLADRGDYAGAGLPTRLVPDELPPGRGWSLSGAPLSAQVALLDADASGPAQTAALERLVGAPATTTPPRRIEPLPSSVALSSLPAADTGVVLGVGGDELEPVTVDLSDSGFVVSGPPRSGRSTALMTIGRQLVAAGSRVVAVAPRQSPLRDLPTCHTDREASYDLEALLAEPPDALLIDDAELLVDSPLAYLLEKAVREMRDTGTIVVAAGTTDELVTGYRGFVVELRRSKSGLLLSPQSAADGDLLGVRLSRSVGGPIHPGRGLLCSRGTTTPLQVAATG
ncbi:MAG: segregation ATPase FtsK/SpoIIIE, family [Actinomycetota bacterium]|nr:segregation ATPase FtsK/SpoIIIE, family [Actinomycetota bacterium]